MIGKFLALPAVADWLIRRAMRTPYSHLPSNDDPSYMERYWLFNPYPEHSARGLRHLLPSIRVHHIVRQDLDRHLHDHPWNARTFILRGHYFEVRQHGVRTGVHLRQAGNTATLKYGEYHKIVSVSEGGVWTLFVTYKYRGTWGFLVDGVKVKWREYLGVSK